MFSKSAFRAAFRSYSASAKSRFLPADPAKAEAYKKNLEAVADHAGHTSKLWKNISLYLVVPALAATCYNTYLVESAHAKHREHLKHVPTEDFPPEYEFQNIRTKDFFWGDGDKTLFWNPVVNRHKRD